jgi:hypothetical protein
MKCAVDHFFVLTDSASAAAARLIEFGLAEGSGNTHPGQGTANRRFFFPDTMFELLYLRDAAEAADGPGARLRFTDRLFDRNASPFGFIVRMLDRSTDGAFSGWYYQPHYLSPEHSFLVGENSDCLEEPLCICMPRGLSPRVPLQEPRNRRWSVTEIGIDTPVKQPSETLATVASLDRVVIRTERPHCMNLQFNSGDAGRSVDLRPDLPLTLSW